MGAGQALGRWLAYLLPCLDVTDRAQQEVGPVEHNGTVGVTAVIEQRHTAGKKKQGTVTQQTQSNTQISQIQ